MRYRQPWNAIFGRIICMNNSVLNGWSLDQLMQAAQELLPPKRFRHTMGVAQAAADLARRYGEDESIAYAAGLLHDLTKPWSPEQQLAYCREKGIPLDFLERRSPALWHAITVGEFVREKFGISDAPLLLALRYHTTGRAGMSRLEKILYLADYIEVNRDFDGVENVRALVDQGLDVMLLCAMRQTIVEVVQKPSTLHPDTIACYNECWWEANQNG